MIRFFFILLISWLLCTAPFWLQSEYFVDMRPEENTTHLHDHAHNDSELASPEHDESDSSGYSEVSDDAGFIDEVHAHRHRHGPGQPEHEHQHEHSQASSSFEFSILATNLPAQILYQPQTYFNQFGLISLNPPTQSFFRSVFRPPIALS